MNTLPTRLIKKKVSLAPPQETPFSIFYNLLFSKHSKTPARKAADNDNFL